MIFVRDKSHDRENPIDWTNFDYVCREKQMPKNREVRADEKLFPPQKNARTYESYFCTDKYY